MLVHVETCEIRAKQNGYFGFAKDTTWGMYRSAHPLESIIESREKKVEHLKNSIFSLLALAGSTWRYFCETSYKGLNFQL